MKKLSIIIVAVMLGLLVAPMAALAQAPVERPGPAAPVSEAEDMGMPEESEGASLSGVSLLAIGGGGALQAGADQLVETQNLDGGWGWPLTGSSAANTIGPIGMGLAQAYGYTRDGDHLIALGRVGTFLLAKTNNFSPSDGYLAAELDKVFGGTTYRDHVMTYFYGPLAAATYNRNGAGALYDTAGYVDLIRSSRASQGIANLAAWDVAMGLVGAKSAGVTGIELDYWIAGTKAEIDELDGDADYDVIGLAGAVYGLAFVGEGFDPAAGEHAAAGSLADLASILASYQINGGGFAWNSNYVIPNDANETIQETAYAILALDKVNRPLYLEAIRGAAAYMVGVQLGTGGWMNYVGSAYGENNEVTAEALWGLAVAEPILWVDAPNHTDAQGKAVVRVMLDPIIDVFGFEFTLTYSPANLDLGPGDVVPGAALEELADEDQAGGYSWDVAIDETAGTIKVWVSLLDNVAGDLPGLTAQSELVRISFTAIGACSASSSLEIVDEILTRKQDGEQILPVTTMEDSLTALGLVPASGVVELQGRASGKWNGVAVSLTGTDNGLYSYSATTDAAGAWSAQVACGTYDVYADMNAYLDAESEAAEIVSAWERMVKLLGGNANENTPDKIFLDDVVAIANVIGEAATDMSDENLYPDINADGTINILDLVLAGINYTEEGPKTF